MNLKFFKEDEFIMGSVNVFSAMDEKFLQRLDVARGISGVPYKITSSFRTMEHNKAVGGKPRSAHLKGLAVDIEVTSSAQRFKIISGLMEAGFKRIGIGSNFIHVDNDLSLPHPVIFTY